MAGSHPLNTGSQDPYRGASVVRARVTVRGAVQGVGFRPFVYRMAQALALSGHVSNAADGVRLEIEGSPEAVALFLDSLQQQPPPHAIIESVHTEFIPTTGHAGFSIHSSEHRARTITQVLPDLAVCPECLAEMRDPANRRYRYPFLNCTHCGPRYSIIHSMPYDRAETAMAAFAMCDACASEYENPVDRRFHAQPTACAACGPRLSWRDAAGADSGLLEEDALQYAVQTLRNGHILALKGLGGFQFCCDAGNNDAVTRLRTRKQRPSKPFAVMFPNMEALARYCHCDAAEREALMSPEAPIVLLHARPHADLPLSRAIAPGGGLIGAMLPYTPLHHLLLTDFNGPLVATSGNRSDEPICIDEKAAPAQLAGIADGYLIHDRPIVRPVDDAVVRVMAGELTVLRSARGYAPLSLQVAGRHRPILALGGHMKNTVALTPPGHIILSQHLGDLDTPASRELFARTIRDLCTLYDLQPDRVVTDLHPDYFSTRFAETLGLKAIAVQHHYAHVLSCMAEHRLAGPVLGIAWDGTGYGADGTVWGGEFLEATVLGFERKGHLRPFRLPGGERAVTEPRRAALGLLFEVYGGDEAMMPSCAALLDMPESDARVMWRMIARAVNSPVTTSAGRLFDGVAAILGVSRETSFEGEAAMRLEAIADPQNCHQPYPMPLAAGADTASVLDWIPTVRAVLAGIAMGETPSAASARFHAALAHGAARIAVGLNAGRVVLTGGCFQNARLLEETHKAIEAAEIKVYRHRRVPPNDGGIAVGQAYFALHQREIG